MSTLKHKASQVQVLVSPCSGLAATPARLQRCHCLRLRRTVNDCVTRASAAAAADLGLLTQTQNPSSNEMWDMGFADCEAESCGLVPDGSVVLVPVGATPQAREDRIAELERGVVLDENQATVIGAVGSKKVTFVLDVPVVSAQHARIEGVFDESPPKWSLFGRPQPKVKYFLTDLKSTNGTYLNRGRLRPLMPVEIKPGDIVAFGEMKTAYRVVQAWARKDYNW